MMRGLAAVTAGITATVAAAGAALGLRRRRRAARRAERRAAKRRTGSPRQGTATISVGKPAHSASGGGAISSAGSSGADGETSVPEPISLRSIKGIGDVAAGRLQATGITRVDQIAAWNDADLERIAGQISISAERIRREDWVGQARKLSSVG